VNELQTIHYAADRTQISFENQPWNSCKNSDFVSFIFFAKDFEGLMNPYGIATEPVRSDSSICKGTGTWIYEFFSL